MAAQRLDEARTFIGELLAYFYQIADLNQGLMDRNEVPSFIEANVKGWLDESGKTHEKIYDVAVSDGRKIGADGRCKTPVGNTVDAKTASQHHRRVSVWYRDPGRSTRLNAGTCLYEPDLVHIVVSEK